MFLADREIPKEERKKAYSISQTIQKREHEEQNIKM